MADRYYDRTLECGCMISSDGGGGVIPCHAEIGDDEGAIKLHIRCWDDWLESEDYMKHLDEVIERNG